VHAIHLRTAVLGDKAIDVDRDLRDHGLVDLAGDGMAAVTFGQRHHADRDRDPGLDLRQRRATPRSARAAEPHQL
jgi:hypothetical protein